MYIYTYLYLSVFFLKSQSASEYVKLSKEHDAEFLPYGTVYQAAEKEHLA